MKNAIIILLIASIGCQSKTEEKATQIIVKSKEVKKSSSKKSIVFFGDSITAGYQLDLSEAFPAIIGEIIDSLKLDYEVINAGLSGETTASGESRVDWVLKNKIDIFVLELGANDGLRGIKTEETIKNLQSIIDKVKAKYPDVKIVLAGMQIPPNMGQDYTNNFRAVFPTLAEKNDLILIPFLLEFVAGNPEFNLDDGIHPNVEGHVMVANNIWNILKGLL
jgi:acyl-CoA thioesterase-1